MPQKSLFFNLNRCLVVCVTGKLTPSSSRWNFPVKTNGLWRNATLTSIWKTEKRFSIFEWIRRVRTSVTGHWPQNHGAIVHSSESIAPLHLNILCRIQEAMTFSFKRDENTVYRVNSNGSTSMADILLSIVFSAIDILINNTYLVVFFLVLFSYRESGLL